MIVTRTTPQRIDFQDFWVLVDRKGCVDFDAALAQKINATFAARLSISDSLVGIGDTPFEALNNLHKMMLEKIQTLQNIIEMLPHLYGLEETHDEN